jgi:hypothetical protein
LFALELSRYANFSVQSLYDKFVFNSTEIKISDNTITLQLKKKRELPLIIEVMQKFNHHKYSWVGNKNIIFEGVSYS